MKTIVVKNKMILDAANEIFGGIVTQAYIMTWSSDFVAEGEAELNERIKSSIANCSFDGVVLEYDQEDILLSFSNGKHVVFSNSEWGYISSVDMDTITVRN